MFFPTFCSVSFLSVVFSLLIHGSHSHSICLTAIINLSIINNHSPLLIVLASSSDRSSLAGAGGTCCFIGQEFLGLLQCVGLLIVDATETVFGEICACLERAREDGVSLDTRLVCLCSWDRLALLPALHFLLIAPENVLCLLHVLLGGASVNDRLTVVEECGPVGFEVSSLNNCVGVGRVHTEELVDGTGRDWLFRKNNKKYIKRYTMFQ